MGYLIGIDIGTTATKTILMSADGSILATATYSYPLCQERNGWAEQDPHDWKNAALSTLKQVVSDAGVKKEDVLGIGLSGQMHGLVMLDEVGEPIRNSIIWCDQRADEQVKQMLKLMPNEKWLEITANPPLAAWTAAKILWIKEHEPDTYARCKKIMLPKDYIRYVLTGVFATDVSDASGMQLMNVKERCWSDEILQLLQIERTLLCEILESQEASGQLLADIANLCGLSEKTIVAAGASDNAAAAVGLGVVNNGESLTSLGTSAVLYTHLDQYSTIPNGSLHICCSAVKGCWHIMGSATAGGLSLKWFKDNFCVDYIQQAQQLGQDVYEYINEVVKDVPIGSDRLIYLPFLMGERTPNMNPDCRGVFYGLSAVHTKGNLLRSIMEGVAYTLNDCLEIIRTVGVDVKSMRVCGGGAQSPVWREILADLYQCKISTLRHEHGAAFGVAILAGVATNVFESVSSACESLIFEDQHTFSNADNTETYLKYFHIYRTLYSSIKSTFTDLAKVDLK